MGSEPRGFIPRSSARLTALQISAPRTPRSRCRVRAASTRSRTTALDKPARGRFSRWGQRLQFRFGVGSFDLKVLELDPAVRVLWQVVDGPAEWIGTKVSFDLRKDGDFTIALFKHQGWKEPVEFMHHRRTKWAD